MFKGKKETVTGRGKLKTPKNERLTQGYMQGDETGKNRRVPLKEKENLFLLGWMEFCEECSSGRWEYKRKSIPGGLNISF